MNPQTREDLKLPDWPETYADELKALVEEGSFLKDNIVAKDKEVEL